VKSIATSCCWHSRQVGHIQRCVKDSLFLRSSDKVSRCYKNLRLSSQSSVYELMWVLENSKCVDNPINRLSAMRDNYFHLEFDIHTSTCSCYLSPWVGQSGQYLFLASPVPPVPISSVTRPVSRLSRSLSVSFFHFATLLPKRYFAPGFECKRIKLVEDLLALCISHRHAQWH